MSDFPTTMIVSMWKSDHFHTVNKYIEYKNCNTFELCALCMWKSKFLITNVAQHVAVVRSIHISRVLFIWRRKYISYILFYERGTNYFCEREIFLDGARALSHYELCIAKKKKQERTEEKDEKHKYLLKTIRANGRRIICKVKMNRVSCAHNIYLFTFFFMLWKWAQFMQRNN